MTKKTSDWLDDADNWGSDDDDDNDDKNVHDISSKLEEDPNGNFETSFEKLSLDKKTFCRQNSTSSSEMSASVDDPNANQLLSPESSGKSLDYFDLRRLCTNNFQNKTSSSLFKRYRSIQFLLYTYFIKMVLIQRFFIVLAMVSRKHFSKLVV